MVGGIVREPTNEEMQRICSPIERHPDGGSAWTHQDGDQYLVTGVDTRGKRFKALRFDNWNQAKCINLYRGTYWLLRNNRRYRIMSVYN